MTIATRLPHLTLDRIKTHSQQVTAGDLFVALPGSDSRTHGARYIDHAIGNGARYILTDIPAPRTLPPGVTWLVSATPLEDFIALAHSRSGHVAQSLPLVAVTGTNGKSTVADGMAQLLTRLGLPTGLFGTVAHGFGHRR